MAASAVSISLSPPAHPGQMAGGHWRGDGPRRFTNEVLQGWGDLELPGVSLPQDPSGTSASTSWGCIPVPALPGTAATCQVSLSLCENQREKDAHQPEKHHVSRNGRFPAPKELPVSISKAALKNTLKYSSWALKKRIGGKNPRLIPKKQTKLHFTKYRHIKHSKTHQNSQSYLPKRCVVTGNQQHHENKGSVSQHLHARVTSVVWAKPLDQTLTGLHPSQLPPALLAGSLSPEGGPGSQSLFLCPWWVSRAQLFRHRGSSRKVTLEKK